jgi:hypothetical protein
MSAPDFGLLTFELTRTSSQKRRMVLIDLCIAVGIPVIIMVLRKSSIPLLVTRY